DATRRVPVHAEAYSVRRIGEYGRVAGDPLRERNRGDTATAWPPYSRYRRQRAEQASGDPALRRETVGTSQAALTNELPCRCFHQRSTSALHRNDTREFRDRGD